jgi:hypothetical protein
MDMKPADRRTDISGVCVCVCIYIYILVERIKISNILGSAFVLLRCNYNQNELQRYYMRVYPKVSGLSR